MKVSRRVMRTALMALLACSVTFTSAAAQTAPPAQNSAETTKASTADYKISPGDTISILVADHPEMSLDADLVPTGGTVMVPEIGAINVSGKTVTELTGLLTKKFTKILLKPHVTVALRSQHARLITVLGDVQKPTSFPLSADLRLTDALGAAGGLPLEVKPEEAMVTVIHRNGPPLTEPYTKVFLSDGDTNPLLEDGDTVSVDSGYITVYVIGQVRTPGRERLHRAASVLEAIASAGGATDTAALSKVKVTSGGQDKSVDVLPALLHGDHIDAVPLHSGDLVTVPVSTETYMVMGYVSAPGTFAVPQGQPLTLATAISAAKGQDASRRGTLTKVYVTRSVDGKPKSTVYNFSKYLTKGDPSQNPTLYAGDMVYVPEVNSVPATSFLGIAGGIAALANLFHF